MRGRINSFEDLEVYQRLVRLHLRIHELTMEFPKHEMYEPGSQLRRSLNSIPANLAEGWNNRHLKLYLEGINRALGELHETKHHLFVALKKGYLDEQEYKRIFTEYDECGRMLHALQKSLRKFQSPNT